MYYKPTPLFRADVREIAHGLIIRTIRYSWKLTDCLTWFNIPKKKSTFFSNWALFSNPIIYTIMLVGDCMHWYKYRIPYSGKISYGANFRIFRMKLPYAKI